MKIIFNKGAFMFVYECNGCGELITSETNKKILPGCGRHECDGLGCTFVRVETPICNWCGSQVAPEEPCRCGSMDYHIE